MQSLLWPEIPSQDFLPQILRWLLVLMCPFPPCKSAIFTL
jgi:hypothetical protein